MMDKDVLKRYQQIRQEYPGISATIARHWQQEEERIASLPPLDWEEYGQGQATSLDLEGFHIVVTQEQDGDHDWTDCRGTFQNAWQEGAIENPNWHTERHSVYRYFVPVNTEAQQIRDLLKMGYGKAQAHELARASVLEDCKIAADPEKAGYQALFVEAKAYREDVLLGQDSCGGIEVKQGNDPYVTEVAWECIHEALRKAKTNLEKLKAS